MVVGPDAGTIQVSYLLAQEDGAVNVDVSGPRLNMVAPESVVAVGMMGNWKCCGSNCEGE